MKNFDLYSMGVQEMNTREMKETDGGFIWFLVLAAAVLLTGCNVTFNTQFGGQNNQIINSQSADSTLNGNSADSTLNGNRICVKPPDW
jgi:Fe-S cluster assembly iron-binding protein IscA